MTLQELIDQQSGNNPAAWANWNNNPAAWQGSLSPELLNGVLNKGWNYAPGTDVSGSNSPSEFIVEHGPGSGGTGEWGTEQPGAAQAIAWHPRGQGAGEPYYLYDTNGKFLRTETGAKNMSNWQGLLAVAGAGLGFGALGAAAGGAAAGTAGGASVPASYGIVDTAAGAQSLAGGAGVTGLGDAGAMYAGSTAGDAGTLGGGGSFTGAGMDSAYAGGAGSTAMGAGGGGAGTPPPANPYASSSPWSNLMDGSGSTADWLKLGSLAAGALGGSKGVQKTSTQTSALDPRMDSLVYGDLAPYTRNLLAGQGPQAQLAGAQMLSTGAGLLGQTAPTTATNPYLKSIADDMQLRTKQLLDQNNLDIQGNSVATGGLGGARQGVAQGVAAGRAADYLQGNVANLYGTAYTGDQNRLLQQQTLGAGLLSQGLDTMWAPAKNAAQIYSPFTGFGGATTQTQSQGGGTMGAVGGAIGAYGMGKQLGWW